MDPWLPQKARLLAALWQETVAQDWLPAAHPILVVSRVTEPLLWVPWGPV